MDSPISRIVLAFVLFALVGLVLAGSGRDSGSIEGPAASASGPTALHFYEAAFARTLDKRFDVPARRAALRLTGTRTGSLVTVEAAGGWSGLEARWANGGTLLLVGYGLLDTWEDSPVPRHLLFKMLEYVTPEKEKES